MRTLRALGSSAALWLLAASIPAAAADVRQALEANLDLAAQHTPARPDRDHRCNGSSRRA
ncbi:MAG: hypothetical protein JRS35_16690 [Deltaproteobacteria bacterium]|nr:hypothetical protein [Deltaproteobacteria bacterium]